MTATFGDLIRYRRYTLNLTPDQLTRRVNVRGHAVDILALEDGGPAPEDCGFLSALAGALEWRVGTLRIARDFPAGDWAATDIDHIASIHALNEATTVLEEMVDLKELYQVLSQWTDELTDRASDLRSGTPAKRITPRFNA